MKRFHVHVGVDNLEKNISFYSAMFGQGPTVVKDDYAKWMLEDPRVNFAISSRGVKAGIDHLGLQVDSDEELAALRVQAAQADIEARDQEDAACCYANSNKYWTTDPQGVAWETFHTLASIPTYGADTTKKMEIKGSAVASACCAPKPAPAAKKNACC
jgi:catechol 2,3-dioxygenase-like lactoylglutathione lyase family enzyme